MSSEYMTYLDLEAKLYEIMADCQYLVELTLEHVFVTRGREHRFSRRCGFCDINCGTKCKVEGNSNCDSVYKYTELSAEYYNHEGELIPVILTKVVEKYGISGDRTLNQIMYNISIPKSIMIVVEKHISSVGKILNYKETCEIARHCTTLQEFINRVHDMTANCPDIQCIDDLISMSKLESIVGRCCGNDKSRTFDYVEIRVPLVVRDYNRNELLQKVKIFKKDIDKLVSKELKRTVKRYKVPVGFLSLSNICLTSANVLVYKFTLKDLDIDVDMDN